MPSQTSLCTTSRNSPGHRPSAFLPRCVPAAQLLTAGHHLSQPFVSFVYHLDGRKRGELNCVSPLCQGDGWKETGPGKGASLVPSRLCGLSAAATMDLIPQCPWTLSMDEHQRDTGAFPSAQMGALYLVSHPRLLVSWRKQYPGLSSSQMATDLACGCGIS